MLTRHETNRRCVPDPPDSGIVFLAGCAGAAPAEQAPTGTDAGDRPTVETANGTVKVHYINVGQSVSTLVVGPEGESMLDGAGFEAIEIAPKDESAEFISEWDADRDLSDYLVSATIEARKPAPDA